MVTTETMISNVYYGIPSGNYDGSSMNWFSDALKAADYYRGHGSVQSVRYQLNGVVAKMYVEATLDPDPDTANWVTTFVISDGENPVNVYRSDTITGNFTWMRIRVEDFTAGWIQLVTLSY